jgi:hypothetical protein
MNTPDRDRATGRSSNPDSHWAKPWGARSEAAPNAVAPRESAASAPNTTSSRCGLRARMPKRLRRRGRFRPQIGSLEQRALLSALPTLTALSASAVSGSLITFTAAVSDLYPGGATPDGGTVTFSDGNNTIGGGTLVDGVATCTSAELSPGTITVSASYGGTSSFAASSTGTIVTAAGDGQAGYSGDGAVATAAELNSPFGLAVNSAGDLFIADYANNVVREVIKSTGNIITFAGDGKAGYSGDGGPATDAELDGPRGLAIDSAGDVFISDMNNNVIREVVASTGKIITYAGDGKAGYSGDGGSATSAELNSPRGLGIDAAGDLFIADLGNNVIREVVAASGKIATVAGDGKAGYSGDGGPATSAELNNPNGVVVDPAGDLFIADENNNAVREVVSATGKIVAFAGDGVAGYSGDGGPAAAAELNNPVGVALDSVGDVFIADSGDNVVREVIAATGDIVTVAGDGTAGYSGDGGSATTAKLNSPSRVAVDSAGDVFIADNANNVVREFTVPATVTITPSSTAPGGGSGGSGGGGSGAGGGGVAGGGSGGLNGNGGIPLTPVSAVAPRSVTRTVLSVQPRSARAGRWVSLTATVKVTGAPRSAPDGSVTFLDGTTELATVSLSGGEVTLMTTGLAPGRNVVRVQYNPASGMVPSSATKIEIVRQLRSRSGVVTVRKRSHPESLSAAADRPGDR